MKKLTTKALAQVAMLIALEIIFTRFLSIQTPIVRIGFGFLPIAIIAILHGPLMAGVGYAIGDLIGFSLFGTGVFFPGFTFSAFLTGVIFGLFLYGGPKSTGRIILAVVIVTVVVRLGLTTLWLSMMFDRAFIALLPTRIVTSFAMAPIMVVLIRATSNARFHSLIGSKPATAE